MLFRSPETYVHRIGRTGRAGASGIAISFCDVSEKALLTDVQKLIRKTIPVVRGHAFENNSMHSSPAHNKPAAPNNNYHSPEKRKRFTKSYFSQRAY